MALRIRNDGRILCAAMHPAQPGDTYIHDGLHYTLSAVEKVLVTESHEQHQLRGEWWWAGNVPEGVRIDPFYDYRNQTKHKTKQNTEIIMNYKNGRKAEEGDPVIFINRDGKPTAGKINILVEGAPTYNCAVVAPVVDGLQNGFRLENSATSQMYHAQDAMNCCDFHAPRGGCPSLKDAVSQGAMPEPTALELGAELRRLEKK